MSEKTSPAAGPGSELRVNACQVRAETPAAQAAAQSVIAAAGQALQENIAAQDAALLGRILGQAGREQRVRGPRWVAVRDLCAVGSTRARQLCVRFGLDPDEKLGGPRCGCGAPAACYRDGDPNGYRCHEHCERPGACERIPEAERADP